MNNHTRAMALLLTLGLAASAEKVAIVAAADLKFCLDSIVTEYIRSNKGAEIQVTYGSSGKAFTQIQQGAPFDLYFSADVEYPRKLAQAGLTATAPRLYALGRIVLWSAKEDASKWTLKDIANGRYTRVAIANPLHAPYGKRAEEALRKAGLWDALKERLVMGENIAQAAQFVQSGSAPIGILALSLVKSPAFAAQPYLLIPDSLHAPLEQAVVLLKRAAANRSARAFQEFLFQPQARRIFDAYGFTLPRK